MPSLQPPCRMTKTRPQLGRFAEGMRRDTIIQSILSLRRPRLLTVPRSSFFCTRTPRALYATCLTSLMSSARLITSKATCALKRHLQISSLTSTVQHTHCASSSLKIALSATRSSQKFQQGRGQGSPLFPLSSVIGFRLISSISRP